MAIRQRSSSPDAKILAGKIAALSLEFSETVKTLTTQGAWAAAATIKEKMRQLDALAVQVRRL